MAKNFQFSYLLDYYGKTLSQKQQDMMEQYYNEDLSLAEIAENFNITRQAVRDVLKRAEGILLTLEEDIGYAKQQAQIASKIMELKQAAVFLKQNSLLAHESAENQLKINQLLLCIQALEVEQTEES